MSEFYPPFLVDHETQIIHRIATLTDECPTADMEGIEEMSDEEATALVANSAGLANPYRDCSHCCRETEG